MPQRHDSRPLDKRMKDSAVVWIMIVGLCVELVVWALIAWKAIGNTYMTHPDYNLPDMTPASEPYNSIGTYQKLQR